MTACGSSFPPSVEDANHTRLTQTIAPTQSIGIPYVPGTSIPALTTASPTMAVSHSVRVTSIPSATQEFTATPVRNFELCSPLEGQPIEILHEIISDPYHPPPLGREERHQGVDFGFYRRGDLMTIEGVGVQAVMRGIVRAAINDRLPYGNMIILETSAAELSEEIIANLVIQPGESIYHLYAHLQEPPTVMLGEPVLCGQMLGAVGTTGYYVVEPHLHLEMRIGPAGQEFPGMAFYDTAATSEEMAAYTRWRTGGEFRHFDPMTLFDLYIRAGTDE